MRSTVRPTIDAGSSPESTQTTGGPSTPRANGLNSHSPSPAPLDSDSLRALSEELGQHFPQLTDETELVLMEISPHQLHAYWHITPWDLQSISHMPDAKNSRLILRFHDFSEADLAHPLSPSFDVEINQPSGSQYIEVWEDARRYGAELGLLTRDGVLLDLARSNTIELPRTGHTISPGTQVLTLTPLEDDLYRVPSSTEAESVQPPVEKQPLWQADADQPQDKTLLGSFPGLPRVFPDTSLLPENDLQIDVSRLPGFEDTHQTDRETAPQEEPQAAVLKEEYPLSQAESVEKLTTQDGHFATPPLSSSTPAAGGASRGRLQTPEARESLHTVQLNPRYAGAVPPGPASQHPEPLSSHSQHPESPAKPPSDRRER